MYSHQHQSTAPSRRVNDLLANSRAEYSRHIQNVARTVRRPTPTVFYGPTLPFMTDVSRAPSPPPAAQGQAKKPAGPAPPRSWVSPLSKNRTAANILSTSAEAVSSRSDVLSWSFSNLPVPHDVHSIPSLLDSCLIALITPDFWEEAVCSLPPHLRSRLVRLAALHRPLSPLELVACWDSDYSGTEGEAIIVGRASFPALKALLEALHEGPSAPEDTWDTPMHLRDANPPPALQTLVLYATPLPALGSLPRSVTHLSLAFVSFDAVRVARGLPKAIPMLEWLDVYECEGIGSGWFECLGWRKWIFLKGVRLRTGIEEEAPGWQGRVRRAIEKERDGDVEICFA